jgi:GNAT superfamily N-acetyltransferase
MEKVIYFAPGLKPVFKHGTHDQSTHGSWANSSERSAKEIEVQNRISNIKVETFPTDEYGDSGSRITAEYQSKSGEKIRLVHDNSKSHDGSIAMDTYASIPVTGGYKQIGFLNSSRGAKSYSQYGATIDSISVDSEYKRQGIGTAMLNLARSYSQDGIKIEHSGQLSEDAQGWAGVVKHLDGQHDQSSHGSWASGGELASWSPDDAIPASPKNAGGMTATIWENWEHGPDGNQYVELYRQYAGEALGIPVPKSDMAPGGSENYLTQRGFGGSSTDTAKKHAEAIVGAIANGKPTQPALYRGMIATDAESQSLINSITSLKPGDTLDMPLVSTTRSIGVASWYAADRSRGTDPVIMKIQPGAKGVSLSKDTSRYPQDHEVITSGKFEVVSINKVQAPYWQREVLRPSKTVFRDDPTPYYETVGVKQNLGDPKKVYEAVASGNWKSLETPTFKLTDDRHNYSADRPILSAWSQQPAREFTVVEVKFVDSHVIQKAEGTDYGLTFDALFNNIPFIRDEEDVEKHLSGQHDQRTHGSWSGGAGVDITSKLDKVFHPTALVRDRINANKETQAVLDEMKAHQLAQGGAVGDNALKIIAERQGFTDKPKSVATLEDLQKIQSTEGGTIVFRGIADYAQTDGGEVTYTGKQAADDFRNGDYYAGWGMFGNGIYATVKLDGAVAYANLTDDKYNRKGNGSVVSMLIPKDAKRASREVVRETMKSVADTTAKVFSLRPTHRNDLGRALAAKGYQYYDAGDVQNNKIGQIVILDRSMLTVAVEDKK